MKLARKVFAIVAMLAFASAAFAQKSAPPHHHPPLQTPTQIHPVPAPAVSADTDEHGKAVEEEAPTPDFKFFDTKILNNKQPPFAALLFNFALLVLIYYRYGKKPIANALKERKISIAGAIEEAQKILREAKQRAKRYNAKLEKVEADAEHTKQTAVTIGEGDAKMLLLAADEKAARIARDAQFLLAQEAKQTQLDLLRETIEKAAMEAEALLRSNVNAQDHERLADEFLKQLETDYAKGLQA